MGIAWIHPSRNKYDNTIENEFVATRVPTPEDMKTFITGHIVQEARVLRIIGDFAGAHLVVNEARNFANLIQPEMLLTCVKGDEIEIAWTEAETSRKYYVR